LNTGNKTYNRWQAINALQEVASLARSQKAGIPVLSSITETKGIKTTKAKLDIFLNLKPFVVLISKT
jgi:hypothetical protein